MSLPTDWPTFHDLMAAYKSCRLGKASGTSQTRFETRLAANLMQLHRSIHAGKYRPAPAKCFIVMRPKPREIFTADFQDRVVHHLVVAQLEPMWSKRFVHSSFACRVGRGSHGAIRYLQKQVRSISQGALYPVWCLQLDIEKFFVSIDRGILCELLAKDVGHPRLKELIRAIYGHDARAEAKRSSRPSMHALIPKGKSWFAQAPGQGIPIGNLTSQFGANVYLTALDHFVQRKLIPKAYLRYMDDLLLLDRDPEHLRTMVDPIDQWLKSNRLQKLNPSKTLLTCLPEGIRYLGYELVQTDIPAQPLQALAEPLKKWRFIQALKSLEAMGTPTAARPHSLAPVIRDTNAQKEMTIVNSRAGALVHANTYRFRQKALEKFIANTQKYPGIPTDFADTYTPYQIKKGYRSIRFR